MISEVLNRKKGEISHCSDSVKSGMKIIFCRGKGKPLHLKVGKFLVLNHLTFVGMYGSSQGQKVTNRKFKLM